MKLLLQFLIILLCVIYFVEAVNEETSLARKKKYSYYKYKHLIKYIVWGFGFHALALLYWLKVKAVIIAFIVGTAIVWGAKYVWGNNKSCPKEIIHEGPIMPFSHGPLWSGHDHIPYSPSYSSSPYDHHHISSDSFGSSPFIDSPTSSSFPGAEHFASDKKWKRESRQRQFESEAQISNIVFAFLGVDSDACRKRFVCEWEFRSKRSPITSLIFRVLGRGIFTKYLRNSNEIRSFDDCGMVYDECRFIEEHIPENEYEDLEEDNNSIIEHSHNDDNLLPTLSTHENNENLNENETETSTQIIQRNYEGEEEEKEEKEQHHYNGDNIVKMDNNKLSSNKVRKSQPEVKLSMNDNQNNKKKKKNMIAETLFNRSKSKLRVVPIRR